MSNLKLGKDGTFVADGEDLVKNTDPLFRLNTKENAKGFRYYEWTVRGDSLEELILRDNEIRIYISEKRRDDANDKRDPAPGLPPN